MKFEDLKNVALIKNPKSGQYEFRDPAGIKVMTDVEKRDRAELEKGILGDEPLGPPLAKVLESMGLDEIMLEYPDDTDMIVIECADLVQSGLVQAMNLRITKDDFAKATKPFELIIPQIGDLATADRARIMTAAFEGGLVNVMLEQSKFITPNQYKVFFELTKAAANLADELRKKPSADLLPEEKGALHFAEEVKKNRSKFSTPIRKAIGEAFNEEEEDDGH